MISIVYIYVSDFHLLEVEVVGRRSEAQLSVIAI